MLQTICRSLLLALCPFKIRKKNWMTDEDRLLNYVKFVRHLLLLFIHNKLMSRREYFFLLSPFLSTFKLFYFISRSVHNHGEEKRRKENEMEFLYQFILVQMMWMDGYVRLDSRSFGCRSYIDWFCLTTCLRLMKTWFNNSYGRSSQTFWSST